MVKKYIRAFWILLCVFVLGKCVAYGLPSENIKKNIQLSLHQFEVEGLYPKIFYEAESGLFVGQRLDNYTDAIYLNAAYFANEQPLEKAVVGDYTMTSEGSPIDILLNGVKNDINGIEDMCVPYARQWFGMETILRPALFIFTYPQIRIISQYIFMLLFLCSVVLIYTNIEKKAAIAYALGIMAVNPYIIPSCINIVAVFYVVVVGAIVIANKDVENWSEIFMYIIGGITCYLDLFVVPLVSFAVLVQLIMIKKQRKNIFVGFSDLVKCAISWILGYISLWAAKWILATLILKENLLLDAFNEMVRFSVKARPDWGPDSSIGLVKEALRLNISEVFPINVMLDSNRQWFLIVIFAVIVVICIWGFKFSSNKLVQYILIASSAPYVWYIVVHTHSFVHFWFSYRSQAGTVLGVSYVVMTLIYQIHKKDTGGK